MFVLGNFLVALAQVLGMMLTLYLYIVVGSAILSWVNPDPYNPIVRFLRGATEPVYRRLRRVLPLYAGGIDFTPMVVILLIVFLQSFLVDTLVQVGARLQ
jgi:YggT family protein